MTAVVIQVGLNDVNPAEAASVAIARLQDLVDTVNADVSVPVLIAKMTPCRQRLIALWGAVDGLVAQQKWADMNLAIAGEGPTPITGVDGRIVAHVDYMGEDGDLYSLFDTGDKIHPNDIGRQINADHYRLALRAAGLPV